MTILWCAHGVFSCPGNEMANHTSRCADHDYMPPADSPHCECGYAGPRCTACDNSDPHNRYFMSWAGTRSCDLCTEGRSFTPTILLGLVLPVGSGGVLGLLAGLFVKLGPGCIARASRLY